MTNTRRTITATQLRPGMRVADNFTEYAQVVSARRRTSMREVAVLWLLADGTKDATIYPYDAEFSLISKENQA